VVAEVEVEDVVRVKRLFAAVDVGLVVNPDGVINQIEGGAIQSTSWTLKEQVRLDERGITSLGWEDYPILKFSEVPAVEVELMDRPSFPQSVRVKGLRAPPQGRSRTPSRMRLGCACASSRSPRNESSQRSSGSDKARRLEPAAAIRKLGFKRWFERELIESHVYLVTCFLCLVLVVALFEQLGARTGGFERALMYAAMLAGGGIGSSPSTATSRSCFALCGFRNGRPARTAVPTPGSACSIRTRQHRGGGARS